MHFRVLVSALATASALFAGVQAHEEPKFMGRRHHARHGPNIDMSTKPDNATAPDKRDGLEKRFDNAKFSFYDAGVSACGGVFSNSDFIVAINQAQYGGGENCFKDITIHAQGKQTTAKIVDKCMGCPYGGLDFSRGLFNFFASEGEGIIYGAWNFGHGDPPPPPPPTTTHKPTSTWTPPPATSSHPISTLLSITSILSSPLIATSTMSNTSAPVSTATSSTVSVIPSAVATGIIADMNLAFVQLGTLMVLAQGSG
ncbi:hypothetical protein AMATHDRAFT_56917 [Amanita thiersii Skay4041]|uniref:RlpA-like protein double-psi beta-barrel domain-containing protein n=1 Tax=Amanita thiersii Skay4041 TaxID=703135 RepID=A0A2A9NN42_9AGAR|nr:hypothetical protein AMATHDRAFT_56917 [Amanita thiersii Skay4041]